MNHVLIVAIILMIMFFYIFLFAMAKTAARADEEMERIYRKMQNKEENAKAEN